MRKKLLIYIIVISPILFGFTKQDSIDKIKEMSIINSYENKGLTNEEAYKMLYENQVKSNDAILKTIYYALGGLGTAVLLVFGSNWWFNDKKVKDMISDIDNKVLSIKNEIHSELLEKINIHSNEKLAEINKTQNKLQEEVTNSITVSTLNFNEFTEKIRAEIKSDNNILQESFQKQLDTYIKNYSELSSTINKSNESHINILKDAIIGNVDTIKNIIQKEKNKRDKEYNEILKKISKVEYYMWDNNGDFQSAFSSLCNELFYVLRNNGDIQEIRLNLVRMSRVVVKCDHIMKSDKERLIDLFKDIPDDNRTIEWKNIVLEKIEKLNVI